MTVFITSSPTGPLDNSRPVHGVDRKNALRENVLRRWRQGARVLMISAAPSDDMFNDRVRDDFAYLLRESGLSCSAVDSWDDRTGDLSAEELHGYDVLLLGGGHVPTQNAFFERIALGKLLRRHTGVIIGVSAGSMNCTDPVYCQPELPGESIDPDFRRFIPGLGLSSVQILPHYQMVRNNILDGKRLFEDITYGDSFGRSFYALIDGSYVLRRDDTYTLYGEGYLIRDGQMTKICSAGEHIVIR